MSSRPFDSIANVYYVSFIELTAVHFQTDNQTDDPSAHLSTSNPGFICRAKAKKKLIKKKNKQLTT